LAQPIVLGASIKPYSLEPMDNREVAVEIVNPRNTSNPGRFASMNFLLKLSRTK
jgi:hypothetical protein